MLLVRHPTCCPAQPRGRPGGRCGIGSTRAGARCPRRTRRLAGAGGQGPEPNCAARSELRSADWAQVRPEWGLAGDVPPIVAPRARSRASEPGRGAASCTTTPLAARPGIQGAGADHDPRRWWRRTGSTCSTTLRPVDNRLYGSGNKLLHNVVGGNIGVFEGNGGDLRIGLPLQSLHDGKRWRHTPLRLKRVHRSAAPGHRRHRWRSMRWCANCWPTSGCCCSTSSPARRPSHAGDSKVAAGRRRMRATAVAEAGGLTRYAYPCRCSRAPPCSGHRIHRPQDRLRVTGAEQRVIAGRSGCRHRIADGEEHAEGAAAAVRRWPCCGGCCPRRWGCSHSWVLNTLVRRWQWTAARLGRARAQQRAGLRVPNQLFGVSHPTPCRNPPSTWPRSIAGLRTPASWSMSARKSFIRR